MSLCVCEYISSARRTGFPVSCLYLFLALPPQAVYFNSKKVRVYLYRSERQMCHRLASNSIHTAHSCSSGEGSETLGDELGREE